VDLEWDEAKAAANFEKHGFRLRMRALSSATHSMSISMTPIIPLMKDAIS
jgi:uncharacterized DUF497 family protein